MLGRKQSRKKPTLTKKKNWIGERREVVHRLLRLRYRERKGFCVLWSATIRSVFRCAKADLTRIFGFSNFQNTATKNKPQAVTQKSGACPKITKNKLCKQRSQTSHNKNTNLCTILTSEMCFVFFSAIVYYFQLFSYVCVLLRFFICNKLSQSFM